MKKYLIFSLFVFSILTSCSSDDDNSPSFDVELLYDRWNFRNLCPDQNNLVLEEDGTFILTKSGYPCDANIVDATIQYTGTFSLSGDFISFNYETEEIIEEGDIPSGSTVEFETELIHEKILLLNESQLFIEIKYKRLNEYEYSNWSLLRNQ